MYLIFAQLSLYATLEGFVHVTWAKLYYGWRVGVPHTPIDQSLAEFLQCQKFPVTEVNLAVHGGFDF